MLTKKEIVRRYAAGDPGTRVDIICKYYPQIDGIINGCIASMKFIVVEQKAYNRRAAHGDPGVRVQTGGMHGDPTADTAIIRKELEDAIRECDFSDGILEDVDDPEQIIEQAVILRNMKTVRTLYEEQLGGLENDDRLMFVKYLNHQITLTEIADKFGIQYMSAVRRINRIRNVIKAEVVDAMELVSVPIQNGTDGNKGQIHRERKQPNCGKEVTNESVQ